MTTLKEFQDQAARFHNRVTLPVFEHTPEAVKQTTDETIASANAGLDAIARHAGKDAGFNDTFRALDTVMYHAGTAMSRLALIKETSTNAAVRDSATDAIKKLQEWAVGIDYREDVYAALKACAATNPKLEGEDRKYFEETMRDYRRAGLELPKAERDEVERLRKEVSQIETDFDSNITKATRTLKFTKAQLAGVPDSFLEQPGVKTGDDEFSIKVNVTWQMLMIMDNARNEDVRRQVLMAQQTLAREQNIPLLEKILTLRSIIAKKLGYKTWADFKLETKMAKTAATAIDFEERLKTGLQPRFDAEKLEFQKIKAETTGNPNATMEVWDWRFCANEYKKRKYNVDAEQLRVYFPYQRVLDGMFAIYQKIFGLKFEPVEAPWKWIDDLQLYAVSDAATGEPMGMFYLDMFPREGKYHHFAQFGIIEGKRLADGTYQRPVVALVCNFPPPAPGKPSLLSHGDVETLFHEFGHAMHSILTRAGYSRFAGTSVPRDFVEAPSQMLEYWVWDKRVLDSFAADYRDPSKRIPAETIQQIKAAKHAIDGHFYRRQLSFGLMDLTLHTRITPDNASQTLPLANRVLSDVFYPQPEGSAFPAYFGHLTGYDAGYYGYAWAETIAADMATEFEKAPDGFLDLRIGKRLRDEIYAPGDSRDVNISIEKFLGRPRSIQPFLKELGIEEK